MLRCTFLRPIVICGVAALGGLGLSPLAESQTSYAGHEPAIEIDTRRSSSGDVQYTPDGKYLFVRSLFVWDAVTGKCAGPGRMSSFASEFGEQCLAKNLSRDGKRVVSAHRSGRMRIWRFETEDIETSFSVDPGVRRIAFLRNGKEVVSWSPDAGTISVWDISSGKRKKSLSLDAGAGVGVFSHDCRYFAVSESEDTTISVWDVSQQKGKCVLGGHRGGITALAFSGDGRSLASGSRDNTIKLWDVERGTETATLMGHDQGEWFFPTGVHAVAFSPTRALLASGGHDNKIKVWDLETREVLSEFELLGWPAVTELSFSPDGRFIAGGTARRIAMWEVSTEANDRVKAGERDTRRCWKEGAEAANTARGKER